MGKTYFIHRKHIHDLDGSIFEALRLKLEDWSKSGKAVEVTKTTDRHFIKQFENNRDYIKYYC
ncbi:hypothetical protein HB818_03740 [Listeria booriae]|uniref:Uncharacterized protein n=1 Tax=Listeria booriae TaxID=1552123 RepID=A0A841XFT4_9LIST|nr:hypothetical protein [Listeria booriae]MBC1284876.1 hypothetical protein [Listeria booriae]MBC1565060.1 hypothetical protein [Listeria booriae]